MISRAQEWCEATNFIKFRAFDSGSDDIPNIVDFPKHLEFSKTSEWFTYSRKWWNLVHFSIFFWELPWIFNGIHSILWFKIAKISFWNPSKKCSDVLIFGRREGVRKDTKMSLFFMSLLRGGGRGSKQIRTMSLSVHFFFWKASLIVLTLHEAF